LGHLHKKETRGPPIRDSLSTFRDGAPNCGHDHGQGPYTFRPLYCMFHGRETNHRTKDCPVFLESKRKMDQGSIHPSPQTTPREVNHTMQWALPHQQYSPSYPSLFSHQAYQNSKAQAPAYYQPYHYAMTRHPQPMSTSQITYPSPTPQIIYPPAVPQITYPVPNNTNPQVKTEANPPPPPP
jgi:hypothetical protein